VLVRSSKKWTACELWFSLILDVDVEGLSGAQFINLSVNDFLISDHFASARECICCYHIPPEPAMLSLLMPPSVPSDSMTKLIEIPYTSFLPIHITLDIVSTMPSLSTCHHAFLMSWNTCLTGQGRILWHSSRYMTFDRHWAKPIPVYMTMLKVIPPFMSL